MLVVLREGVDAGGAASNLLPQCLQTFASRAHHSAHSGHFLCVDAFGLAVPEATKPSHASKGLKSKAARAHSTLLRPRELAYTPTNIDRAIQRMNMKGPMYYLKTWPY